MSTTQALILDPLASIAPAAGTGIPQVTVSSLLAAFGFDVQTGTADADTQASTGGLGNDTTSGATGTDILDGGDGNDVLSGGA